MSYQFHYSLRLLRFTFFISCLLSTSASYADFVLISDQRSVPDTSHTGLGGEFNASKSYWEADSAIRSNITDDTMTGELFAWGSGGAYGDYVDASFEVEFTVTEDTSFLLDLSFTSDFMGIGYLRLSEGEQIHFEKENYEAWPVNTFTHQGTLLAGQTYNLEVYTGTDDTSWNEEAIDFNLQLTQVPVPAAAWLFSSALMGLVGFKRKK